MSVNALKRDIFHNEVCEIWQASIQWGTWRNPPWIRIKISKMDLRWLAPYRIQLLQYLFVVDFHSVKRPFQDCFSSYDKVGCLTCAASGVRTHTRHSDEMIEWLNAVMKYQRA